MKKKVILSIVAVLIVFIGGVLIAAATKPDTLHIQRAMAIQAPPQKIFALINDFHKWNLWSPYDKKDSTMKRTYSGAPNGVGAKYEWAGNSDVGTGHMEIIEAPEPSKVTVKLHFIEPFESESNAEFTLQPEGNTTKVTWAMHGPNHYLGKVMSVFFDMDDMIGKDFEAGLVNMKNVAEKS